jgi:hypothetical protein
VTDVLNPADRESQPGDDREPPGATEPGSTLVVPAAEPAPASTGEPPTAVGGTVTRSHQRAGRVPADDALSWVGAVANLGAAVVHFGYAQVHLNEEASHGAFFLVAGWAQLMLALGLGLRAKPRRVWTAASVVVNLGILGVWLVSRTVGVPGSDPESIGLADLTACGLQAVAVLAGAVVLMGTLATRSTPRPGPAAIGVTALLVGGLVTASVTPAVAGGHAHDESGAHGDHDMAGMEGMEGMEHGHDGAGAADDFATARLAALEGYLPPEQVDAFRQVNIDYLSEQLRTRSDYLKGLPEADREQRIAEFAPWAVDNALKDEVAVDAGQTETMHTHGPTQWIPIEGTDDQAALQEQLRRSATVITEFPTAADAMAAGYRQVTPYVPGIGAHYLNLDRLTDGEFVPDEPEMLLYNGNDPGSELVGLSYGVLSDTPPEGFVGQNDIWHQHPSLCLIDGLFVVGPDHTSEEMCASIGGRKGIGGEMQMAHVWQVPGWESPWGLFSGENPNLNMVTTDVGK